MKKIVALPAVLLMLVLSGLSMGSGIADTYGQQDTPNIVSQVVTGETVIDKKADALVNGIVTKINEDTAKGSWRYEFNNYRGVYELDIRIVEHMDKGMQQIRLETIGSSSGFWSPDGPFTHVAEMKQISRGEECTVYVFAWGDTENFEAAILPDSTENKALFKSVFDLNRSEVLGFIKDVIDSSDYVVYGETKHADF